MEAVSTKIIGGQTRSVFQNTYVNKIGYIRDAPNEFATLEISLTNTWKFNSNLSNLPTSIEKSISQWIHLTV